MATRYTNTYATLLLVAQANGLDTLSIHDITWPKSVGWWVIENQATKLLALDPDTIDTFIDGEVEEAKAIAEEHHLNYLHEILDRAFDGDLRHAFYTQE